jgi:energy-coupling factor transporter ATP-binding protein EcfA2
MKVLKIKLFKYKRFLLSGVENFEMEVGNPLVIILGTNGSGKSSLLDVLNPLPATRMEFGDGGFKEILLESRGSTYLLRSDFHGKSGHHSFIKDHGEDLNPGGTSTVQRELVAKHLGYDQGLHDILTGRIKLTEMAPAKRNQWIMSLSNTDFTYANRLYEQMKDSARDATGALKHSKNRLAKESAR